MCGLPTPTSGTPSVSLDLGFLIYRTRFASLSKGMGYKQCYLGGIQQRKALSSPRGQPAVRGKEE